MRLWSYSRSDTKPGESAPLITDTLGSCEARTEPHSNCCRERPRTPIDWSPSPDCQLKPATSNGEPVARVVVDVMLKSEILDPQGRAVAGSLRRLGLTGVTDVRQGKQFIIDLDGVVEGARLELLETLAAELLSNPVIEDYKLEVIEDPA